MNQEIRSIDQEELNKYRKRGYANEDVLPKSKENRTTDMKNFFTLWMGSIHNIPNYAATGGFLFVLGLSPIQVILGITLSGLAVALFMSFNGRAGVKYGIPFSMHLRSTYGNIGAKLPGFLRGAVAAIAWFGVQTFNGSVALLIILGKLWPGFLEIGNGQEILGITIPGFIAFMIFWAANMAIGFGGGEILNKFTTILTPIIYVVFGSMTVWAIKVAGGIGNILSYTPEVAASRNVLFGIVAVMAATLSVWAAPGASISDFTQNATSNEDQTKGQIAGLFTGYLVFAFMSVTILVGATIHFGGQEDNVLNIIQNWDSLPAILISTTVFLLTTISTNATGNIIPAAYQLSALLPQKIDYRKGVMIAGIISIIIMPWKLGDGEGIMTFLNLIGALLGPVGGVMIADYYFVQKQEIDLDDLYLDETSDKGKESKYHGVNIQAYIATLVALGIVLLGQIIPALSLVSEISWVAGFILAAGIYIGLTTVNSSKQNK